MDGTLPNLGPLSPEFQTCIKQSTQHLHWDVWSILNITYPKLKPWSSPSKLDLSIVSVPSDFLAISFSNYSGLKPWYFLLSYLTSNLAINVGSSNFQNIELFSLILFLKKYSIFCYLPPSPSHIISLAQFPAVAS